MEKRLRKKYIIEIWKLFITNSEKHFITFKKVKEVFSSAEKQKLKQILLNYNTKK